MAAIASAAGIAFCVPARRNRTGTRFDAPRPMRTKPAMATAATVATSNTAKPVMARRLPKTSVAIPDARHDRVSAKASRCHGDGEKHVAQSALRLPDKARADQQQGAPVEHGA